MKEKILLIMATRGFLYEGSKAEGYTVVHPYKTGGLVRRLLREFSFRYAPSLSERFYNQQIFQGSWDKIVIWDPLITRQFLEKIHGSFPAAQIDFIYWNMVGKAHHILPGQIPDYVHKWTYDGHDAKEYGLRLYSTYPYYRCFIRPHIDCLYDVLFVGRDKGRGEFLLDLEKRLQDKGLKTKFIITKTGSTSLNKKYYQRTIPYSELCDLISHSRSVLNVIMDNQEGLTLRDLEYVYQGVKLLTTNQSIVSDPIYDKDNVFIIKDGCIDGIESFLQRPMAKLPDSVLEHHTFDSFIKEITE